CPAPDTRRPFRPRPAGSGFRSALLLSPASAPGRVCALQSIQSKGNPPDAALFVLSSPPLTRLDENEWCKPSGSSTRRRNAMDAGRRQFLFGLATGLAAGSVGAAGVAGLLAGGQSAAGARSGPEAN